MVRSLMDLLELRDPRVARRRGETALTEEQFRRTLDGAAEIFREESLRVKGAIPSLVVNDPGAIRSRKIKLVDIGEAELDELGTGGNADSIDQAFEDQVILRAHKTVKITDLLVKASQRGGMVDLWRDSGNAAGQVVVDKENDAIINGGRGVKGLSNATGIQTFASAGAWTTAGDFWKDILKVQGKMWEKKIPTTRLTGIVHPTDLTNAFQVFSGTADPQAQVAKMMQMIPGGLHASTKVTAGKAYFHPGLPNVFQQVVYEDLHVVPLPRLDEEERMRVRTSFALHKPRPEGIVEVTSIDA